MPGATDDLDLALELADVADRITLERFRADDLVVETKPDLTPVSEADTAVERAIRERLAVVRPGDAVMGEEYGSSTEHAGNGRRWIDRPDRRHQELRAWDPGVGDVAGAPGRRRAVGRGRLGARDGPPLVGFARRRRVRARRARRRSAPAAWCRGFASSRTRTLSYADIEDWENLGRLDAALALARACWRSRSLGDFWAYMLVAEGAIEIALDPVASLWDLAAPQLIVEEAGGRFSDLGGARTADGGDAIATNGPVHEAALALVGR